MRIAERFEVTRKGDLTCKVCGEEVQEYAFYRDLGETDDGQSIWICFLNGRCGCGNIEIIEDLDEQNNDMINKYWDTDPEVVKTLMELGEQL